MRYSIALTLGVACAAALGFWAGTAWRKQRRPAELTPGAERSRARVPLESPRTRAFATALLDTDDEVDDLDECRAARMGWQMCREQLFACRARDEELREPFPEGAAFEDPDTWEETVSRAVRECGEGMVQLDSAECSHYPCVGGLRRTGGPLDKASRDAEETRLMKTFRECEPLRAALGGEVPEDAIDVFPYSRRCEDGSHEDFWILMALDPAGEAWQFYESGHDDDRHIQDIMRWMYRRGEDLATQWRCESDPS